MSGLPTMSLWSLLRHRLRAAVRAPFVGRRALSLILAGFVALYLGGGLVLLGILFDDLVREAAPGTDPLRVASRWLLPLALLYAALRVVVESGLGIDVRPYLALPTRWSVVAGLGAVVALVSLWNAVPMAFVATVGVEAAVDGAPGPAVRFGLVGMAGLAMVTFAVPVLRRGVTTRPLLAAAGGLLVVASAGVEWINVWGGVGSLLDVSGWLFGGAVAGRGLPVLGTIVTVGGAGGGYVRWLRREMDLDRRASSTASTRRTGEGLGGVATYGPGVREAVLKLRLILRNSKPRFSGVAGVSGTREGGDVPR